MKIPFIFYIFDSVIGKPAFRGKNMNQVIHKNRIAFINFNSYGWTDYSKEIKMFAKCLLTKLPENRISMAKIANLKWMRKPIKNEFNLKDSTKLSLNSKLIPSNISLSSESNSSLQLNKLKSKSFMKIKTNKAKRL